jgi:hypothetical protein
MTCGVPDFTATRTRSPGWKCTPLIDKGAKERALRVGAVADAETPAEKTHPSASTTAIAGDLLMVTVLPFALT